jgi:hypothetical protein
MAGNLRRVTKLMMQMEARITRSVWINRLSAMGAPMDVTVTFIVSQFLGAMIGRQFLKNVSI